MTEPRQGPFVPAEGEHPALAVEDLIVEFAVGGGRRRVVDEVSFELAPRETLGLVGQSGSGKSMTALAIMGLLRRLPGASVGGSVRLAGRELVGVSYKHLSAVRGAEIAMVLQDPMSSLNPAFTVGEQIAETIRAHMGVSRRTAFERAVQMLDLAEIPAARRRVRSYPHEFSGGMRQRVTIAMALSCQPRVLIADEPTTALDVTIQAQILDLLRRLQAEMGMAILMITHDLGVVADICDRVAVMYAGQVVETAMSEELFEHVLSPYTEALLRSTPEFALAVGAPALKGSAIALTGCRFAPRCPYALPEVCEVEVPLVPHRRGDEHPVRCHRADELALDSSLTLGGADR